MKTRKKAQGALSTFYIFPTARSITYSKGLSSPTPSHTPSLRLINVACEPSSLILKRRFQGLALPDEDRNLKRKDTRPVAQRALMDKIGAVLGVKEVITCN